MGSDSVAAQIPQMAEVGDGCRKWSNRQYSSAGDLRSQATDPKPPKACQTLRQAGLPWNTSDLHAVHEALPEASAGNELRTNRTESIPIQPGLFLQLDPTLLERCTDVTRAPFHRLRVLLGNAGSWIWPLRPWPSWLTSCLKSGIC
jgi:hypothetical protein